MTMYDKLGALLSEALEKGELPAQKEDSPKVQFFFVPEQKEKTDSPLHKSNQRKSDKTIEQKKILTGEVIKTKFIPENVKSALSFIGISENTGLEEAKKIYNSLEIDDLVKESFEKRDVKTFEASEIVKSLFEK